MAINRMILFISMIVYNDELQILNEFLNDKLTYHQRLCLLILLDDDDLPLAVLNVNVDVLIVPLYPPNVPVDPVHVVTFLTIYALDFVQYSNNLCMPIDTNGKFQRFTITRPYRFTCL